MPVIQSASAYNTHLYFNHCAGFGIKRSNVCIRGLKFVGNANPATPYYYPVERDSASLENLEVSQCYFIGEKNSSPVQGALYVQGAGIHVDHCIFYGCNYLWFEVKAANLGSYKLNNSLISRNEHTLAGQDKNGGLIPFTGKETYQANGIRTSGEVLLIDVKMDGLPKDYLNLLPASAGYDLHAGIFKK